MRPCEAGDALETLSRDLPDAIDLVLLDGAKVLYPKLLAPRLAELRAWRQTAHGEGVNHVAPASGVP